MTVWLIVVGVLLLLLLGQLRLGVAAGCPEEGEPYVILRVGPFRWKLLPAAAKQEKPPKTKKKPKKVKKSKTVKSEAKQSQPKKQKGDILSLLLHVVPPVAQAAGKLLRKIRIDRLELRVIWGAADPASAAVGYGRAQAAMGILWPPLEHNFRIKEQELSVDVDFDRRQPTVIAGVQLSLTLGQLLSTGLRLTFKLLPMLMNRRRKSNSIKYSRKAESK